MANFEVLAGATIAFDLDGTLVDTAPDLIATLNVLLEQEGVAPVLIAQARPFIGHGARHLIERGLAAQGRVADETELDDLLSRFINHYKDHSADLSVPFPGAAESLTALKAAGARLAVCTNKLTWLSTPILEALDLSRYFDAVIGADAAPARKPDPRHLVTAVQAAGGDIRRAVMVGDAATDAGAARAAGTSLVLVSFGYTETPVTELGADVLIDHFDELIDACRSLLTACPAMSGGL